MSTLPVGSDVDVAPQPIEAAGPVGPVVRPVVPSGARSAEEIRTDLARRARGGLGEVHAYVRRLVADVEPLLAEVEAEHRFEQAAALDSARLAAVEALVEQARKVSPSASMTVYVGDLEKALGRRADAVRGVVGAGS